MSEPTRPGSRPVVGFAPGVYDLFHIGHLNLLQRASLLCDRLVAGVVSDEVALLQKGRHPVVSQDERVEVVAAMDMVDEVYMETQADKFVTWQRMPFDVIFKGDDWRGHPRWVALEQRFATVGVTVCYLPYTDHTSTSKLRASRHSA